jgi:hypothetical protein
VKISEHAGRCLSVDSVSCFRFVAWLHINIYNHNSQVHCSSVGIALGYGLDGRGSRVRFLAGAGNFSLHHRVPALGPTQPPIQWVPRALSLGVKRPGREADHSPPSSGDVKE